MLLMRIFQHFCKNLPRQQEYIKSYNKNGMHSKGIVSMFFDNNENRGHESIHHFSDPRTGLKAIIAIHLTALGPAGGGCRMWHY